jgi:hypothetical protein
MSSEREVLQWVAEDSEGALGAPVRMLSLRLAMNLKTKGPGTITGSVELALNEFQKGTLIRILRGLESKGLIYLVSSEDNSTESFTTIGSGADVYLTEHGKKEVEKLQTRTDI